MTSVTYNNEPTTTQGVYVGAAYNYVASTSLLASAQDPHYAGAMSAIKYIYAPNDDVGVIQEEQNFSTGVTVTHLVRNATQTVSTETRGDHDTNGVAIMRTFNYGGTAADGSPEALSQLNSSTDFQGYSSACSYFVATDRDGNGQGYLASSTDPIGYKTAYTREPILGRVKSVSFSGTNDHSLDGTLSTSVWTNADDNTSNALYPYFLHSNTNERGQTTTFWHDGSSGSNSGTSSGMVRQVDYPDGSHEYFWYRSFSRNGYTFYKVSMHQDQLGTQLNCNYDEANHGGSSYPGLMTSVVRHYANGYGTTTAEATNFYYDAFDRVSQTVDPRNVTECYTYNGRHQLTSALHNADNTAKLYGYDTFGRCTSVEDELQHSSFITYDEYGRPISVQVPVNSGGITTRTTQYTYDGRGSNNQLIAPALSHTDARFSYEVLPSGRGVQRIYSQNGWITDEYTGQTSGNPGMDGSLAFSQSIHTKQNIVHDPMGRQGLITDAQGHTWTTPCDGRGRPLGLYDPLGNVPSYTNYYPPGSQFAGLVQCVVSSGNDAVTTLYKAYTNYDAMGRPTAWGDAQGNVFGCGYDSAGNLSSQSDGMGANGHPATGYSYDGLGRKVMIQYADGTTEHWHYDASGNVSQYTNRGNNSQLYDPYDLRNRPTSWHWSDPSVTAASAIYFDAIGRCITIANGVIQLNMCYDDSGAIKSEYTYFGSDGHGATVSYAPDVDGNISTITYPHGDIAWTPTDFAGRVGALNFAYGSSPSAFYGMATYGYTNDQLTSRVTSYNLASTYFYQANNRPEAVDHHDNSNNSFSHQTYGYNPDGQMSWFLRTGNSATNVFNNSTGDAYYYRADSQLSTVKYNAQNPYSSTNFDVNNPAQANPAGVTRKDVYGYDAAGNRTSDQEGIALLTPTFDSENRQSGLGYDANGNTTTAPYNGGSYTYTYNAYNQLISASGSGNNASFVYDPLGRVVQRTINGITSRQYYAGNQVVEDDDASNNKLRIYLYGASGERTFRIDSTVYCYVYDGRGYLSHITNPTGSVVEQYLYDAFGWPKAYNPSGSQYLGHASTITGSNRFLWSQGYEWFNEIGLYKCGARFYSPTLARFMQTDPIGQAGGLNVYQYCGNDPTNGFDPSGLDNLSRLQPGVEYSYTGADGSIYQGYNASDGWHDTTPNAGNNINAPGTGNNSFAEVSSFPAAQLAAEGLHDAQQAIAGVGDALSSTINAIGRPVQTAQKVGNAARTFYNNPAATANAITNSIIAQASNPNTSARFFGNVAGQAGIAAAIPTVGLGAAKASLGAAGSGTTLAKALGDAGELAAGVVKNTERIPSLTGTASYRIPDILNRADGVLGEVKNVNSLSYTNQLRDFTAYAQQEGLRFQLTVRPTTQLSGPLQQAIGSGQITLNVFP